MIFNKSAENQNINLLPQQYFMYENSWPAERLSIIDLWIRCKNDTALLEMYDRLKMLYPREVVAYYGGKIIARARDVVPLREIVEEKGYSWKRVGIIYVDPELTRRQVSHGRFL